MSTITITRPWLETECGTTGIPERPPEKVTCGVCRFGRTLEISAQTYHILIICYCEPSEHYLHVLTRKHSCRLGEK